MTCSCERSTTRNIRGVVTPVARYVCTDGEDTASLLGELVGSDAGGPHVDAAAARIRAICDDDPAKLGPAVQLFVQKAIAYHDEPRETFQSAEVTLLRRSGDCDDHARLVIVLAKAVGLAAQLVIMRKGAIPVHAVAKVADAAGELQWAETTLAAQWGEHPVAAKTRLGHEMRADL